jgi:hypothetical protein
MNNDDELFIFFKKKQKECPKGISLRREGKNLYLVFIWPDIHKRLPKGCNCDFTEIGIITAVDKANKICNALKTLKLASEFWSWYDSSILEKNTLENDLLTYREIFTQIENEYFNGRNKNTKRKRSKDIPNDIATFHCYYGHIFLCFPDLDAYPTWEVIKSILFSWKQGSKTFKDVYSVIKKICEMSANSKELLVKLSKIKCEQTEFKKIQSISLEQFLTWYKEQLDSIPTIKDPNHRKAKKSWLWVIAIILVYGLRPTEVTAAKNLTKPVTIGEVVIPALNDPDNHDLLLVLDDFTYFGTSIKTGGRICKPMVTDKELIDLLDIKNPDLPICNPQPDSKAISTIDLFANNLRRKLKNYKCPVTETYALRHLANQLGELYGIPQEIRARSLGHSVAMNDSVYKARNNTQTTIDLLTNHSKLPISLNLAKEKLTAMGINTTDPTVETIIRVIYQLG